MREKLKEEEVLRLVEEVSKLDEERRQLLDKEQVAQILRELNLSDDLLDEAMLKLDHGRVAARKKRAILTTAGIAAAVVAIVALTIVSLNASYTEQLAKVTASQTRITTQQESSADLSVVSAGSGTVFAQVTLHDVPLGTRLPLRAQWVQPDGSIYHENNWQTKPTDKQTWETHAKCNIASTAAKGDWLVKLSLGGRLIASKKFVVN